MNFCPDCESFLYLYINKDDGNKLSHKCKNCGYKGELDEHSNKEFVYTNSLDSNSLDTTYNILNNKFIIKDPTLPRLNNIECINPNCLTNSSQNSLVILNIENFKLDEFITFISEEYKKIENDTSVETLNFEVNKIDDNAKFCDYGEFHSNNIFYDYDEIKDKISLLVFKKNIEKLHNLFDNGDCLYNPLLNKFIIDKTSNIPIINIIHKKMVFIKYDSNNMKYMYICSTCGTSWKNIT